jgi:hypothetical protein
MAQNYAGKKVQNVKLQNRGVRGGKPISARNLRRLLKKWDAGRVGHEPTTGGRG